MKLEEQILKSYLLISSEHVTILSALKNREVWLIQVNYCLAFFSVCEMLPLEVGKECKSEIFKNVCTQEK
jgi:hypothetical protein